MVTPDYARFEQDRKPGLIRELHQTLAARTLVYRNTEDVDYDELLGRRDLLAANSGQGYVLGLPYGHHLKLHYEFDGLESMRSQFAELLNDLGRVAVRRAACRLMVMDFTDFANRHHVNHILMGADFDEPVEWTRMRCRDVREQPLPAPPAGITVRVAGSDDADAIAALDERVSGDQAIAPPLPDGFFGDAGWVGVAEQDGALRGYVRLLDAERRGLQAEELVADPDHEPQAIRAALLHAAFAYGRAENRRGLALRVGLEAASDPLLAAYGLQPREQGLLLIRPADPEEVLRRREAKATPTYFKIGKIWGKY